MRVYLPSTLPQLAEIVAAGGVGPAPVAGFAVTGALREWYVSGDLEELEYAAMTHAARASLHLIGADPDAPRRRVVLAADVPDQDVLAAPGAERGCVHIRSVVPLRVVVSVHADGVEAEKDVAAAAEVISLAETGDEDAQFVVDGVEDHELLWYATQEIPDLLK
jgi:hypothetical protein